MLGFDADLGYKDESFKALPGNLVVDEKTVDMEDAILDLIDNPEQEA